MHKKTFWSSSRTPFGYTYRLFQDGMLYMELVFTRNRFKKLLQKFISLVRSKHSGPPNTNFFHTCPTLGQKTAARTPKTLAGNHITMLVILNKLCTWVFNLIILTKSVGWSILNTYIRSNNSELGFVTTLG